MKNVYKLVDNQTVKDEAADWLIRIDGDQVPDEQVLAQLREWCAQSPQHREQFVRLAAMWDNLNVLTELAVPVGRPAPRQRERSLFDTLHSYFPAAAATALIIAVLLTPWLIPNAIDRTNGIYATTIGQQKVTTLADGSTVELNTNSELRVEYGDRYRDIHLLHGEAHFDVAENKKKPLRVFAGKGRVQAVGTAFSVYLHNQNVQVTVTDGRVSLAGVPEKLPAADDTNSVSMSNHMSQASDYQPMEDLGILVAGQGATLKSIPSLSGDVVPATVLDDVKIYGKKDINERLSWRRGLLIFAGDPLERVVEEISRYTTVEIEITDPAVRTLRVGGQFAIGDTEMMLDALEDTFALRVKRVGDNHVQILAASN